MNNICVSPDGVRDLPGQLQEWVVAEDDTPIDHTTPGDNSGETGYLDPLGEATIVPATGLLKTAAHRFFAAEADGSINFVSVIASQGFLLSTLLLFGLSFAIYYPNRNY